MCVLDLNDAADTAGIPDFSLKAFNSLQHYMTVDIPDTISVAKLSAPPNLEVRYVSCNESAKKRCLSSELEETVCSH